jgi:hypothetical protein
MCDEDNDVIEARYQELGKQLSTYADSFAAFSFVQGAAFSFLVVQNAAVACQLRLHWVIAGVCLVISGAVYVLLLQLCKRGEDKLLIPAIRGETIMSVVRGVRLVRLGLVLVATVGEIALVIATHCAKPFFDCSKAAGALMDITAKH